MPKTKHIEIDFGKVSKRMKELNFKSEREFATSLGRNNSTVATWRKTGFIPDYVFPLFCQVLQCEESDLLPIPPEAEQTQIDTHVIAELGEIKGDLATIKLNLQNLFELVEEVKESISPDLLTDKEKAVIILKQMMGDSGRVDERDYVDKCNSMGIDNHSRKFAIEKTDSHVQSLGYGSTSKRVIFRSVKGVR